MAGENGGGVGDDARRQAREMGERAREAAGRAREVAEDVQERARGVASDLQDRLEGMRGYAEDTGEWLSAVTRERPVVAIAVAVGLGFVIGRMLSRA